MMSHNPDMQRLDAVLQDDRLSANDKAIYVMMTLRVDATGEYRLGVNYLCRHLNVGWHTVKQSIERLTTYGWIAPVNPGTRYVTWRIVEHPANETLIQFAVEPTPRQSYSPQDAPRMAMPPTLASELLQYCIDKRRLYDAALTSDMQTISPTDRTLWQSEADRIDDTMDTLTRWLARFGGGIPDHFRKELGL